MNKRGARIYRRVLLGFLGLLLIYSLLSDLDKYFLNNWQQIVRLLKQHLILVSSSLVIATSLGLTVGILFSRPQLNQYQGVVMYIVGLGQTIPSLAVLALAMSFLGIGRRPAILALTIYTVLPIARNTLAGLEAVGDDLIDAARGMGLTPLQILLEVELPNALRVILTGFRLAMVINIGTAALGTLVGAGGLGEQIFTGISFLQPKIMLSGALPTAFLALIADYGVQWLERILISDGLQLANNEQ